MTLKFALRAGAMLLAYGVANAHAAGWYAGYGAQFADYQPVYDSDSNEWDYNSGTAHQLFGGMTFNDTWALELGYSAWGLEADYRFEADEPASEVNEIQSDISVGVRSSYPLLPGLSAELGMGVHQWESEDTYTETDPLSQQIYTDKDDQSEQDFYYSLGVKYHILPTLEAGLDYSKYNVGFENIEAWRLSIAYYFQENASNANTFNPSDFYVRGLVNYNKPNLDKAWTDDFAIEDYAGAAQQEEDTSSVAYNVVGGLQLSERWSAELGYIDLGESGAKATLRHNDNSREEIGKFEREISGFTFGFSVNAGQQEQIPTYFRFGIIDWDQTISRSYYSGDSTRTTDLDGVGVYAGMGVLIPITSQLVMSAEFNRYTHIPSDNGEDVPDDYTDTFGLGVQYHFGAQSQKTHVETGKPGADSVACDPKYKDVYWNCD